MCKRLFVLVLLLAAAPSVFGAPIGIFGDNQDVGNGVDNPLGIGYVIQVAGNNNYLIGAGGDDIWNQNDQFHFAYNEVTGNIRVSLHPEWQDSGWNDWAKVGAMLRESTADNSVHYSSLTRKGGGDPWSKRGNTDDSVFFQRRTATGDWSGSTDWWGVNPERVGMQRIVSGGYEVVQALVDQGGGAGWQAVGTMLVDLPDTLLAGVAVTAHDNAWMVQARVEDVQYDYAPGLIGVTEIPRDAAVQSCGSTQRGFNIKTAKAPPGWDLNTMPYEMGEYLAENGELGGDPSLEKGERQEVVVNLHDSGGRFLYGNDQSFPGIDPFEQPTSDPAAGDDDEQYATLVTGCIELTAGLHAIGGHADDGVLIRIGGVEIGRTASWNSIDDFLFNVEVAGLYPFRAVMYEQGGGSDLELYEVLPGGVRILLNDLAGGGSAVYVPEPATIALLGFGGLAMLRVRRKR